MPWQKEDIHETKEKNQNDSILSREDLSPKIFNRFLDELDGGLRDVFFSFLFPCENDFRFA